MKAFRRAALVFGIGLLLSTHSYATDVEVRLLNQTSDGERGFEPALVFIKPGDSVRFAAVDPGHSVQSIDGMLPDGAAPFGGNVGETLTVKFDTPGVYGYRCVPHHFFGMVGLVVVGNPDNEAAARSVAQPRDAKARFDKLFAQLDRRKAARK